MRIYLAAIAILALLAITPAQSEIEASCPVAVEIDYAAPTGPVQIIGCLVEHTYIAGGLLVKVRSTGDLIYVNGFDPEVTP